MGRIWKTRWEDMGIIDKKQFAKEFEFMINLAKAKAYSKVSLERPLTNGEFNEFKKLIELIDTKTS